MYLGFLLCILNFRLDYIVLYIFGLIVFFVFLVFVRFLIGCVFLKFKCKYVYVIYVKENNVVNCYGNSLIINI